jgi:hypothetical protein
LLQKCEPFIENLGIESDGRFNITDFDGALCYGYFTAVAHEVDEVKDIRDKARAIEVYARQAKNFEAERKACEIRLRAERKAGQILAGTEKAKGGDAATILARRSTGATGVQTLADLGISKDQSSSWQQLADRDVDRDCARRTWTCSLA